MKQHSEILEQFRRLDGNDQEKLLIQLQQEFESKSQILDNVRQMIEDINLPRQCPKCRSKSTMKRGKQKGVQMYQCKECNKWFSETTGTSLYNIKKKNLWQEYLRCMQDGKSIKTIAKEMGISIQTSFDWRHKILSSLESKVPDKLGTTVECDELEFALSNKGDRNLNRKARKRGTDFKRNTESKDVTTVQVVTSVDRESNKFFRVVETKRLTAKQISKVVSKKLDRNTIFITDEHPSYKSFAKKKKQLHIE